MGIMGGPHAGPLAATERECGVERERGGEGRGQRVAKRARNHGCAFEPGPKL